jgi:hypothetical protein
MGKHGTYIFTKKELERALDRENFGVKGEILPEGNFAEIIDEWYKADLNEGIETCEDILKEPHAYGIQPETPEGRKDYRMVEQDLEAMKRRLAKREETETYENREEWLTLAEYSLSLIKHSAHDKKKRQTISEFLNDLKTVMENTIRETNT